MSLLKGDVFGLIAIFLIFSLVIFLIWHFSFLPEWFRISFLVWFLIWFLKELGIIFGAPF
ncbi:MAG TPA: hypothetical protein PLQ72_02350 [Candidatus Pacearchaeota archaeon]|nr:hypothetical protein [Candidatus Pacearchaeota archaeon]